MNLASKDMAGDLKVRGPFVAGALAAGMRNFADYQAKTSGLENLLEKAKRSLDRGDDERANAFITRVIAMTDGDGDPPWSHAHMLLHSALCDDIDESAEDDSEWLDRALQLLPELDGLAELELIHALWNMTDMYRLGPQEGRRIRAVVGGRDPGKIVDRMIEDGDVPVLEAMRQILTVVLMYERTAS